MRFVGDIATKAMVTPHGSQYESVGRAKFFSGIAPVLKPVKPGLN